MALSKEDLEYGYDEVAKIQQETDIVAIKLIFDARHRVKELIEQESSGKLGIQRAYVYEKKSLLSRNSGLRRWFEGRDSIYTLKPLYKRVVDVHWDHKKTTELGSLVIGLGISITLSVVLPPLGIAFAIKGLISGVTVLFATNLFENQRHRHRPNRKYNKKNFSAMKQSEYGQKLSSEIDVHLKNMRFIEHEMNHNCETPEREKQFLFENYKAKEVLADLLANSNIKSQMHAFDDWDGSFGDSARRMVTHIATILTPFSELIDSEFFSSIMTCKEQELDEKFFTLGLFDYELKRIINYAEVITDTMLYLTNQFSYLTKFEPMYRNAITVGCRTTVQIGYVNDKVIGSIRKFDSSKKIAQALYKSYDKYKSLHKKHCSKVCYCYERSSDTPLKIKSIRNPKYSLKPEDPKLYFRYVNPSITQEKKYFQNIFNLVDALKLNGTSEYHTFVAQMILKEHHQIRYLNNSTTHSHPSSSNPDDLLSAEMYKRANYVQRRSGESSDSKRPDLDSDKTHNDFISYLVDPDFFHLQSQSRSRDAFKLFKDTSRLATLRIETLENYYNYQQALGMDFSWSRDYQKGNPYHELLNSLSDNEKNLHMQFVKALSKGEERVDSPRNVKDWMSKRKRNMSFTMLKATMRDVFFSISGSITTIVLGGVIGHHSPHIGNFVLGASPASTFASNVLNNCDALNKIPFIK